MKPIALIYTHVIGRSDPSAPPPEYYLPYAERFVGTYRKFNPGVEHDLVVVVCGPVEESSDFTSLDMFPKNTTFLRYTGGGWDCGAHQFAAKQLNCDWVVCLSSPVYFKRSGWLARFSDAWTKYGDGLYGTQGSFEHATHIRTSCFAFKPDRMREYPNLIDTREKCRWFETQKWNLTQWFIDRGLAVKMVTWDGEHGPLDFRTPPNIFRRGDQSNCLTFDRHNDVYDKADPEEKVRLEKAADGK